MSKDVTRQVSKNYYVSGLPDYVLVDIDKTKVWLHPNDKQVCLCWVDLNDLRDYGFDEEYETSLNLEKALKEKLVEDFCDDVTALVIDMADVYWIMQEDPRRGRITVLFSRIHVCGFSLRAS